MKILALIPARGGSVRLPGKNLKNLGGKPLITWSIEAVKGIPEICDILVSTNDPMIAEIAEKAGAFVPWLRPNYLATSDASSVDVALHALNWYESQKGEVDGLLLLQPTSPFRTKEKIRIGIELFEVYSRKTVIGVSTSTQHPRWTFIKKENYLKPYLKILLFKQRFQNSNEALSVNGNFYLISPKILRRKKSFFKGKLVPHIIESKIESIDIDFPEDFLLAELVLPYVLKSHDQL